MTSIIGKLRAQWAVLSCVFVLSPVCASPGLDALNFFFHEVDTFEARFGQVFLDEQFIELDSSQGMVWVARPGMFRWSYQAPDAQEIVGDGMHVWIYDIELEQVSVQVQDEAIGQSPAFLLAGSGNVEDNYRVIDIGTQGRFDWVNLVPKDDQGDFQEVRIGFEDNRLRLMELLDTLGQRTRISFVDLKENLNISSQVFEFIPPEGIDVIDYTEES